MKIFNFLTVLSIIFTLDIFQYYLLCIYLLAFDGNFFKTFIRNLRVSYYEIGEPTFLKVSKLLKLTDLKKILIVDVDLLLKITNDGIGSMKGYRHKLRTVEDEILALWIIKATVIDENR